MQTNLRKNKYDKDAIFDAVVQRMREKGKGFFIISCGGWIHPLNTVLNCYAIMFDGFIQYKFQLLDGSFRVAEIRDTQWLKIDVKPDEILTHAELLTKIKDAV